MVACEFELCILMNVGAVTLGWESICERVCLLKSVAGWPVGMLVFKKFPFLSHFQSTQSCIWELGPAFTG